MPGPFDDLVGELTPGQVGWLNIDAAGYPTGEPATVNPPNPGPDVFASSVMCNPNSPLPDGQHLLLTSTGADLSPPLQSNVEKRDDDWKPAQPPQPPTISALTPNTAVSGDPTDIEMRITGTGFTSSSVIVFNSNDEPTDYFSPTEVGTGVKPSLFVVPAVCPVSVRNGTYVSNSLDFEFTAPELEGQRRRDSTPRRK
jgi:hypothetical protein